MILILNHKYGGDMTLMVIENIDCLYLSIGSGDDLKESILIDEEAEEELFTMLRHRNQQGQGEKQ